MRVMPIFRMRALRIVADVDVIKPRFHIRRAMGGPCLRCIAGIGEFTVVTFAAEWAFNPDHRLPLLMPGVRSRTLFFDQMTGREPLDGKFRIQIVGLILGNCMRKAPARCRRRLKAAVTPPAIDKEARNG